MDPKLLQKMYSFTTLHSQKKSEERKITRSDNNYEFLVVVIILRISISLNSISNWCLQQIYILRKYLILLTV